METPLGVKKTEPDSSAKPNDRKITLAEIHGILIKHKKKTSTFDCEGDQIPEHSCPENYGISISGDSKTQNPTGRSPDQPALGNPAGNRTAGLNDLLRSLPISTIQRFCIKTDEIKLHVEKQAG